VCQCMTLGVEFGNMTVFFLDIAPEVSEGYQRMGTKPTNGDRLAALFKGMHSSR
jgi:hypothetical protein